MAVRKKTTDKTAKETKKKLPLVALRDTVMFPTFVVPFFIGRKKSMKAIEIAADSNSKILFVTQKDQSIKDIVPDDLYDVGTVCRIDQMIELVDGTVKILAEGLYRAKINKIIDDEQAMYAMVSKPADPRDNPREIDGLLFSLTSSFENFFRQNKRFPTDILPSVTAIEDPSRLCDTIASYLPLRISEKQGILEAISVAKRIERLIFLMEERNEMAITEKKIKSRVKKQVEKNQREYYLNEQLKAIYRELGGAEDINHEIKSIKSQVEKSSMSKEAKEKVAYELKKLQTMAPMSQESGIIRTYIDWLINLPWERTKKEASMDYAEKILNKSHYGLEKVKERIMEYIAVQKRVGRMKAQIMCFVGPPGVGKTSLGRAIADATRKSFERVALGGVSDEAEIRGHRRAYIGATPGKIIQALKKAKFTNPVIMLDEIDKLDSDWKGDPASALLEVLDPEQNHVFVDHYIEIAYDLSEVMFITTANSAEYIPSALLDRMEVIHVSGYTEEDKLNIASKFIVPKQFEQNGLKKGELNITEDALKEIISNYTMESGVRNLERRIAKITRKAVRKLVSTRSLKSIMVDKDDLAEYLGPAKYKHLKTEKEPKIGVVTGLAWTETGGEILPVEALLPPGSGNMILTGKLGEVMQESIKAAYSYVKSRYKHWKISLKQFSKCDVHVHAPEGAVPKDGPSAGVAVCTAIVSVFTGKKVRADIAMTGEITLTGKVLAIGGLKEKLLAARRAGIKKVFIPKENERDVPEVPKTVLSAVKIQYVEHVDEILREALIGTSTDGNSHARGKRDIKSVAAKVGRKQEE